MRTLLVALALSLVSPAYFAHAAPELPTADTGSTFAPDGRPKTRLAHVGFQLDGGWSFFEQALAEPFAEVVAFADPHADLRARAQSKAPAAQA